MRRFLVALAFAAAFVSVGCSSDPSAPDTVAEVRSLITADLTPAIAEKRIGKPDAVEGSGLLIYRYNLQEGAILRLSFPGYLPIVAASITYRNGTQENLTIN